MDFLLLVTSRLMLLVIILVIFKKLGRLNQDSTELAYPLSNMLAATELLTVVSTLTWMLDGNFSLLFKSERE